MDPRYNYIISTLLTPQVIQQPAGFHTYPQLPIQQLGLQPVCFDGISNAQVNSSTELLDTQSNISLSLPSNPTSTRPKCLLQSSRYIHPRNPRISPHFSANRSHFQTSPHSRSKEIVTQLVPLMSINLPPDMNTDHSKLPGLCPMLEKILNKRPSRRAIGTIAPSPELPDEAIDHVTDQMNAKLRLDVFSSSPDKQQGSAPSKEISASQSNLTYTNPQSKSFHSESAETKFACKTSTVRDLVTKYKCSVSGKLESGSSCTVSSCSKEEKVASNPKPLSWADVAATLPKPKPLPLPSTSKRSNPVTSSGVERHAAPTRLLKKPRERRNRRTRAKISVEQRERLLTRYRTQLEKQKTTTSQKISAIPAIHPPKKKRLTRLKAGILRDRLIRRTLRTSLQQQQQIIESTGESEVVKQLRSTGVIEVTQPKVEKITLPVIPSLEEPIKEMLTKLAAFQDRAFKQTENALGKRKNARRIVCGFHEVIKSLKVKKLRFFIVANDLERGAYEIEVESPEIKVDGTSEAAKQQMPIKKTNSLAMTLKQAVDMSREQGCPVVMAFKRRHLQKLCHKGAPISCVGVINVAGAEDIAKLLKERYLRETQNVEEEKNSSQEKFTVAKSPLD
ncbi:unnamed protein product [Hymenolepis diminuta]|uniref:Uncharacterized protein n=1 Tax=Hymenolepis diminuta TaxID=6216 RepID=A0A564ZBV4_HYMDI|nr:unnamed protein product [Hymenolepis diminuta]